MVEDKRIKEFERMLHMHHEDKLTDYMEEVSAIGLCNYFCLNIFKVDSVNICIGRNFLD